MKRITACMYACLLLLGILCVPTMAQTLFEDGFTSYNTAAWTGYVPATALSHAPSVVTAVTEDGRSALYMKGTQDDLYSGIGLLDSAAPSLMGKSFKIEYVVKMKTPGAYDPVTFAYDGRGAYAEYFTTDGRSWAMGAAPNYYTDIGPGVAAGEWYKIVITSDWYSNMLNIALYLDSGANAGLNVANFNSPIQVDGNGDYRLQKGLVTVQTYGAANAPVTEMYLDRVTIKAIPEPSTMATLFVGLLGLGAAIRKRQ